MSWQLTKEVRELHKKNQLYIPRFCTNRLQSSIKCRGLKVRNDIPNKINNNDGNFQLSTKSTKST